MGFHVSRELCSNFLLIICILFLGFILSYYATAYSCKLLFSIDELIDYFSFQCIDSYKELLLISIQRHVSMDEYFGPVLV